ncbi:MAG: MliC family protein [Parvibaculaceae bacterium]
MRLSDRPLLAIRPSLTALALLFAASPAFASSDESQFVCEPIGDGHYVVTVSSEDSETAKAVYMLDGDHEDMGEPQEIELKIAVSGSGFRYVGGGIEFHGKGDEGILTEGEEKVTCSLLVAPDIEDEDDRVDEMFDDADWPPHRHEYGNTNTNRERSNSGSGGGTQSHGTNR